MLGLGLVSLFSSSSSSSSSSFLSFSHWVFFFFSSFSFFLSSLLTIFSRLFFALLVLSKLYSVICCGVEGVGGVNDRICYGGLV